MAFDVSHDRSVYAYGFKSIIRSYAYRNNEIPSGKGKFVEANLPSSSMVITDIRFSPRDGSIYATVDHSDSIFRCDPTCPDGIFIDVDGRLMCEYPSKKNTWLTNGLVISCKEWGLSEYNDQVRLLPPEKGYNMQGGCQVFNPSRAVLLCASGTYRPPGSEKETTRVWIVNTGEFMERVLIFNFYESDPKDEWRYGLGAGQLIGPPAYHRFASLFLCFFFVFL